MADDVTFSDPPDVFQDDNGLAALLPWNYFPADEMAVSDPSDEQARIVMALPDGDRGLPALYAAIGAEALATPKDTIAYLQGLDMGLDRNSPLTRYFLGPPTRLKPSPPDGSAREVFTIIAEPWDMTAAGQITEVVVIIDAGIAFWNRRFRNGAGPRFQGVRYLDFDRPNIGQANHLDATAIAALCSLADREGNGAVMRALGERFPNSVFGAAANPSADGFWHGTAVADLAVGAAGAEADHIALFALDLPRKALADFSGEILTSTLALILPAAIAMTAGFAQIPLTIVMPLGFPAGPQDGTHPAAASIAAALANSGRRNVRLVLPAGNHLQDRCHARLSGSGAEPVQGIAPPSRVFWDLAPDDFSVNQIEIFGPAGQSVALQIAAPGQALADVTMPAAQSIRTILRDGRAIGYLLRHADAAGWSRTRLVLWPAAPRPGGGAAPFGRWTLATRGSANLDAWVLRDDRNPVADRFRPRRPSVLWDPWYQRRGPTGAPPLTDDAPSAVRRSGTLSVLATTLAPAAIAVQANERLGQQPPAQAGYSGRRQTGRALEASALVDDGWTGRGTAAAANGGPRRIRMSGTSAAAGIEARRILGLGPVPEL